MMDSIVVTFVVKPEIFDAFVSIPPITLSRCRTRGITRSTVLMESSSNGIDVSLSRTAFTSRMICVTSGIVGFIDLTSFSK